MKTNKNIKLIIVINENENLYNELKLFEFFNINNVYYTTYDKLHTNKLYSALFNIDEDKNIYGYNDYGLNKPIYMGKI